jgi:NDP-sugar pyrophosphorylase family protein
MVVRTTIFNYLGLGELESDVFPILAENGLIDAYKHSGFWMSVNTPKELEMIRKVFRNNKM